jgi:hypothetical protein
MRAIRRDFSKVEFVRVTTTIYGDHITRWNAHQAAISAKATIPLPIIITPDEWSRMRRASIAADTWLVGEQVTDEWEWWR